jgi:hypothetical protein
MVSIRYQEQECGASVAKYLMRYHEKKGLDEKESTSQTREYNRDTEYQRNQRYIFFDLEFIYGTKSKTSGQPQTTTHHI